MTPSTAALWRPPGAVGGGWHPTASCAHYVRLQAVTDMSPFGRMTPPAAAMWRPPGAMVVVASYRQLRSLRSLASGYGYVALQADDAACGGKTLSFQPFTQWQEFFNFRDDAFLFGKRGDGNEIVL